MSLVVPDLEASEASRCLRVRRDGHYQEGMCWIMDGESDGT